MTALTVLHISDLHRDPDHELTNAALLDSLLRDRDRYRRDETPVISDPNVIIVSGDIVHGVKADATDPESELKRQYEQAESFLISLADNFVNGDREKVIIIPGNHDVSYFHMLQSMKQVEVKLGTAKGRAAAVSMGRRLQREGSQVRWSWRGFCFYEISDQEKYNARLEAFCTFYGRFYQSKRSYSLKSEEQFDIFDLPEHNVAIAGLSSCHENDPLNKKGAIHPDCVASAVSKLCGPQYRGRILLATWHHNTSGGPSKDDYMDADILQVLIDDGFSIGFHGHQHKPQFIEDRQEFGGTRKITVVSAGTLCAGPKELPSGHALAYNILELNPHDRRATLHIRRMQNQNFSRPIWGPGHFAKTNDSFVTFDVQAPIMRSHEAEDSRIVGVAETAMRANNYRDAVELLRPIAPSHPIARKLLWECYISLDDFTSMIAEFYPPSTVAEVIHICDALVEVGDADRLAAALELPIVRESEDTSVIAIREKHAARRSP